MDGSCYMNQILYVKSNKSNKTLKFIYRLLFFFFCIASLTFSIILSIKIYKIYLNQRISKKLTDSYSISTLYSDNESYSNIPLNNNPFVIGIIRIDKINLNYSILSSINNDLLDISVCRFAGPMPNEIGNLCIAGHNYVDYKLFSRLNELELNDIVIIYDLYGTSIKYHIYDIYETNPKDTSCTFQNTNNQRIITLITCNNVNGKRLVIHAKEIP